MSYSSIIHLFTFHTYSIPNIKKTLNYRRCKRHYLIEKHSSVKSLALNSDSRNARTLWKVLQKELYEHDTPGCSLWKLWNKSMMQALVSRHLIDYPAPKQTVQFLNPLWKEVLLQRKSLSLWIRQLPSPTSETHVLLLSSQWPQRPPDSSTGSIQDVPGFDLQFSWESWFGAQKTHD